MDTTTFSISFLTRKCKADKKRADIYARITVDGIEKELSTKEQIPVSSWDSAKSRVKGNSIEVKSINEHLDNIKFAIKEKYRKLLDDNKLVTAETVRDAYLGNQAVLKGHTLKELLAYYTKIWKLKLKEGGFKNYKTTIKYLNLFLAHQFAEADVFLSQVNGQFATDFEHYIRTQPVKAHDPCKGNGVGKHIQRFKRILTWAADDLKWIKENQCRKYSCAMKKSKREKLDMVDLIKLEEKEFMNPSVVYIKELFLNSCYTGLAFAEAMALSEHDFEWNLDGVVWCKMYRTKSDELFALPVPNLGKDFDLCYGEEKKLDAGNFNQYEWNDSSSGRYKMVNTEGLYWVTVSDMNHCAATDSVWLKKIFPLPADFLKKTDSLCEFDKLTIMAVKNYSRYLWSTGSVSSTLVAMATGQYTLTVTDGNNCVGKDSILIVPKSNCTTAIFIPNAFTPNGDHLNDLFKATVFGNIISFRLQVYNRWGQQVFTTENPADGWDGKMKGEPADPGVFIWLCTYQLEGQKHSIQKGTLMLIR